MHTGDVVSSTIATVSLIATAIFAYRQTRIQARLTTLEETRRREELEARQHADVRATARQPLGRYGPPSCPSGLMIRRCFTAWTSWSRPQPRCGQGTGSRSRC
jgi:hypothetical protein